MSAILEPGSGAVRMVAGPLTTRLQPSGAMNVLPATVVFGVSAASRSGTGSLGCAGSGGGALAGAGAKGAGSTCGGGLTVGGVDEQAAVVTRRTPRNARMRRTIHGQRRLRPSFSYRSLRGGSTGNPCLAGRP